MRIGKKKAVDLINTKKIETMTKATFYPTDNEQQLMMDIVINEFSQRHSPMDNYNVQELAYRQAISDGAMRTDYYFNL